MSNRIVRVVLLSSSALVSFCGLGGVAAAQTPATPPAAATPPTPPAQPQTAPPALPTINVETTKKKPAKQVARRPPPPRAPVAPVVTQPATVERQIQTQVTTFNDARSNVFTTVGANSQAIGKADIQKLPQGENTPVDKVLLQSFPGVSRDSAASGSLHVRNEHANVAYRINGIMLPDGVTGFGSNSWRPGSSAT